MLYRKIFVVSIIVAAFWAVCSSQSQAQTTLTPQQRSALQAELAQVEAEQKQAADELAAAQAKSASLSGAIAVLDAKIKTEQLNIRAKTLLIQSLGNDIVQKQSHINDLEDSISAGKQTLATILRKTNELDQYSLPEILLSSNTLSGFLNDMDTFQSVQDGLKSTFLQLRSDEASTSAEKDALTVRQNAEEDARHAIQVDQANLKSDQADQKQLLSMSKGNEKAYSALVAEKQARAAQIRVALFQLAGGSNPIPFGVALQYAQAASYKTGVDPAFLLAILKQESNLGANVGRCYLSDPNSGAGVYISNGTVVQRVMNPTRDVPPFLTLTKSLGMDPYQSIVSCQLDGIGWGGAMGPAQFIASTWSLIEDQVAGLLSIGSAIPNPWNPQHAIMAEALFMANLGANSASYTAQLNAACRYFGGGTKCTSVTRPYGLNVMQLKDSIQRNQIDLLQG